MKKNKFLLVSLVVFGILSITSFKIQAQHIGTVEVLFNGENLEGWETVKTANAKFWSVQNGVITGGNGIDKIPVNTYLKTKRKFKDFEFRCLFRLSGSHNTGLINSGIQYRSIIKNNHIIGYQADIGKNYWGDIYDEHRRALLQKGDLNTLKHLLKEDGWNSYIIRCKGNKHELYINGIKTNEYIEKDANIPNEGVIGLQLHSGGKAKIELKAITISPL